MSTIGVPKETKQSEGRVGLTPTAVAFIKRTCPGSNVMVEYGAGDASGYSDHDYVAAGSQLVNDVWQYKHTLIVKVKEPQPSEISRLSHHKIFGYFHFASDESLTKELCERNVSAFAYETLVDDGKLPLLDPMSDIAGRVCVQRGATFLPILLGGVAGTQKANVLVAGAGVVGTSAANMAKSMGARVTIADINAAKLKKFEQQGFETRCLPSGFINPGTLRGYDVLIGAVHVPGKRTPIIAHDETIHELGTGLFIDVSIDQGGCLNLSKPTTHESPTYKVGNITCYSVANLPGIVPRTSSEALSNASMKYVAELCNDPYADFGSFRKKYKSSCPIWEGKINDKRITDVHSSLLTYNLANNEY